ncbi:aldolase catalytic domain-containing protein [Spongiibacter marinus]|uniref:aldolase catalytic domain-containing protein n=1 Tax=Spongiibacter marinus TaxID=354246 RepID=UPI000425846E|nr:aldolase catalytic domain-containing protein [Spongiibacter marinus]
MKDGIKLLDCTLRDGGYYNHWDFSPELIDDYLLAMAALNVDYVEIGFRSLNNNGFKGGCAYSTDKFISNLNIPKELSSKIGVMVNGSELLPKSGSSVSDVEGFLTEKLSVLFKLKEYSPVTLVRIACHVHEFRACLPAASWLKNAGYLVGFNLMQVAERTAEEVTALALEARDYPIDALYFADSMGSLDPEKTSKIITAFKRGANCELGIHTHDNMGLAIANTQRAVRDGVLWVDSTVTGMGRGPGNSQTEYLALALQEQRNVKSNPIKLFELIRKHFKPMQNEYGWGTNPYYYLAGKYGIHPSYVQEMLSDNRFNEEDILAVINHLKLEGGKKFSSNLLEGARHFYSGTPKGQWCPQELINDRDVLIIGTGPGVMRHKAAIESFIKEKAPFVIALNTQQIISADLINVRAACHPVRLLADCAEHLSLPEPILTPASMLPNDVRNELMAKEILDFGLGVKEGVFEFNESHCLVPAAMVAVYALAVAASGKARKIFLVGFDGYSTGDVRNSEMNEMFRLFCEADGSIPLVSLTPTTYQIPAASIYGQL